jgi:hypothetical protein
VLGLEGELPVDAVVFADGTDLVGRKQEGSGTPVLFRACKEIKNVAFKSCHVFKSRDLLAIPNKYAWRYMEVHTYVGTYV